MNVEKKSGRTLKWVISKIEDFQENNLGIIIDGFAIVFKADR